MNERNCYASKLKVLLNERNKEKLEGVRRNRIYIIIYIYKGFPPF